MTTGSLVVLLEGGPPASLGTASPTSCNEGSRYIATRGEEEKDVYWLKEEGGREERQKEVMGGECKEEEGNVGKKNLCHSWLNNKIRVRETQNKPWF